MEIQFSRGRLSALMGLLEQAECTLMWDLHRASVACRDDYHDDPAWQRIVSLLTEATADIIRARDAVGKASNLLWEEMGS